MFCCAFCYILMSKRQKLLSGLARFLEYIVYNNIIKIGIHVNHRSNSSMPAKKLMQDVNLARNILQSNIIVSIMEIPFTLCLLVLIFIFSKTNGAMCVIYILSLVLAIMIKKTTKTDKQANIIENDVLANKTFFGEDLLNNVFYSHEYIYNNIDVDKISQYYSNIDETRYEGFIQSRDEVITYPSIIKIITLLFQITLVLNSIYLFIHNNINLGAFILTIGFVYHFLQKTSWLFQIFPKTLHIMKATQRITKAIKTFGKHYYNNDNTANNDADYTESEIRSIEDETLNNTHLITRKNNKNEIIINNLYVDNNVLFSYHFKEGNLYVLNSSKYKYTSKIFKTILNRQANNKDKILLSTKNNSYKDIFYCPIEPIILYGKIIDIATNFEENINNLKLENILNILNLNEDLRNEKLSPSTILNTNNVDKIDIEILKKINLASALYSSANVLLFENPFLFIDKTTQNTFINFLIGLKQLGKLIIISSNNREIIEEITNLNGICINIQ